jgi:hypothetical protein
VVGAQSVAVPLDHRRQPHERLARRGAQVQSSSDQDSSFSAPRTMAGPVADLGPVRVYESSPFPAMLIGKQCAGPNEVLVRWRWLLLASPAGPVPSRGVSATPASHPSPAMSTPVDVSCELR